MTSGCEEARFGLVRISERSPVRRLLPVVAVGVVAGAALLVPAAASATPQSYWSTTHEESPSRSRVVDPASEITWTVLDHKIMVTTPDLVVVPVAYTCGTADDSREVLYDVAVFQTVYEGSAAAAYTNPDGGRFPVFTCDGSEHVADVVLSRMEGRGFENGNVEIGLIAAQSLAWPPRFEHAVVGYDQLHDSRASVAVTVNATPESTGPGSKITVKGTVERDGKAYKGKSATLYFQTEAGDPAEKIASAVTDRKGRLKTKVVVSGPGTYFWTTTSTTKTQAGASLGDYADAT